MDKPITSRKLGETCYYFGRKVQVESVVHTRGRVYVRSTEPDGSDFYGWVQATDLTDQPEAIQWLALRSDDAVALIDLLTKEDRPEFTDCLARLRKALENQTRHETNTTN